MRFHLIKEWTSHMCNGIFFPAFSSLITWGLQSPGKSICKTSRKQHWRKTLRMAIQRDCLFSLSWIVLRFFFSLWPKISSVCPQRYGVCLENILQKVPLKHYNHRNKLCHRHSVESCLAFWSHAFQRNIFFCWEMLCRLKSMRTTLHL